MDTNLAVELALSAGAIIAGMSLAKKMPEGYKPPVKNVDWAAEAARFRAEHKVQQLTEEHAGKPVADVPNGIYGFAYAPGFETPTPVFGKPSFQSFETHRLPNGDIAFLGCLRPAEAEKLNAGEFLTLRLYPEPYDDAVVPVVIYLRDVLRSNNRVSRGNGNFIEFDVKREG